MNASILILSLCLPHTAEQAETRFVQVYPAPGKVNNLKRSPGQQRAVVLIHGLRMHLFDHGSVPEALMRDWQQPESPLVKNLAKGSDVFAFAYGQNVPLEAVADSPRLREHVARLKKLGYADIVLAGHSAGGLIARHFLEDHPDAGVTKVVQICTPNGGSSWGTLQFGVPKSQMPFLATLTPAGRRECLSRRAGRKIPEAAQFICVVGTGGKDGDGVVPLNSQWPEDLQKQGVPVFPLETNHFLVVLADDCVSGISGLVRDKQLRWDSARVRLARERLLAKADVTGARSPDDKERRSLLEALARSSRDKDAASYRAVVEARAARAVKERDVQGLIDGAFALYPLEARLAAAERRHQALLRQAADIILAAEDPAAAQRFCDVAGPLMSLLPAAQRARIVGLASGKPVDRVLKEGADRILRPVRKLGSDLTDPEVKGRGGLEKDLAEALANAVMTCVRPSTGLSETPPALVKSSWAFPEPGRATVLLEVKWGGRPYTSRIQVGVFGPKQASQVVSISYADDSDFPPPDEKLLQRLVGEINNGLKNP